VADKVLVNLATGMEDGERVLVAFLVATAAGGPGNIGVAPTTFTLAIFSAWEWAGNDTTVFSY
jgi:hypothetical protein